MSLTIHQSGIDAAINAQASGFAGVTLNRVDLYNGSSKIKPLTLKGVQVIEPSRIYVVAQDSTTDVYDVTKMEFYTDGGALFATAQNDDGSTIQSKAANATLLLAHQLNLSANPGTVAPSGDVSIYAPQATESLLGTAEIATQGEVDTGTDHTRIVTPKTLKSRLASFTRNATESMKGFLEIATQTEANGSSDDSRAITPKKLHNRTATESRRGVLEIATQSETDSGSSDLRIVTPKKLWALLTAKFARKDVRPIFAQGINTGGKPIVYSGSGTNTDHIWYNDTDNTYHAVADASEGATGNANFKLRGIQLNSGSKITGYSDSITSTSNTIGATVGGVKKAHDAGTRQTTESTRGQAEIATQAEVNAGTDHQRIVTPKTFKSRLASWAAGLFKSAAYKDAGQNSGQVALIGDPATNGNTAVIVSSGSNANGHYRVYSDGFTVQEGQASAGSNGVATITLPIEMNNKPRYVSAIVNEFAIPSSGQRDALSKTYAAYIVPSSTGSSVQFLFLRAGQPLRASFTWKVTGY
ncbi:hypothetical protein NX722_13620 [Endozoicomonas gorgoniicola]|uniref:Uncharacterized protein n=1 Tax=Endozoicomonas gorgoniicola TaxID=1234144 RepID=A0ABT3MW86_9GAMM|nr:hypothetical protein [Endozoicomonas gorgoniicola]MCW7553647.1 hypothetical protein [Endozoicomonas gorgoniicola]